MPQSSPTGMPIAWKNSSTSSGVGAAPTLTATTSSRPSCVAQLGEHLLVGLRGRRGDLLGHLLAGLLERGPSRAPPRAPSRAGSRCSSGRPASMRLEPGLQLLPDPRHGEEPGRPHLGQELDDLARVGADRDRAARWSPAGSSGRRARRCGPPAARRSPCRRARGSRSSRRPPRDSASRLRWVSWTPFGGPGRAGGVDQGQQVVEARPRPTRSAGRTRGRSPPAPRASCVAALAVDDDHVLELGQLLARLLEAVEERRLDDRDLRARRRETT